MINFLPSIFLKFDSLPNLNINNGWSDFCLMPQQATA
jgi:hypothetical protein